MIVLPLMMVSGSKNMAQGKISWPITIGFLKKYWPWLAGGGSVALLVLLFWPIIRFSWLDYPEALRGQIALKKLAASRETSFYCREDCQAKRLLYQRLITAAWTDQRTAIKSNMEKLILDPKTLPETRRQMIDLWQSSGEAPSDKLTNYVGQTGNLLAIKIDLTAAWPELGQENLVNELVGSFKTATSTEQQAELLSLFQNHHEAPVIDLLWDLILNDYPDNLKAKAFFLLANVTDKAEVYQAADLAKLQTVINDPAYPARLKDRAIQALDDYYLYYPKESEALLLSVVEQPERFDKYQRSFAIEILNGRRAVKLATLDLSQADWDAYYHN
jgi:hypothetical protein